MIHFTRDAANAAPCCGATFPDLGTLGTWRCYIMSQTSPAPITLLSIFKFKSIICGTHRQFKPNPRPQRPPTKKKIATQHRHGVAENASFLADPNTAQVFTACMVFADIQTPTIAVVFFFFSDTYIRAWYKRDGSVTKTGRRGFCYVRRRNRRRQNIARPSDRVEKWNIHLPSSLKAFTSCRTTCTRR